jgi:phytoene dehydrogenase-like protein
MQAFDLGWRRVFGVRDGLTLARFRASIGGDDADATNRSTFEYLQYRGFSDEVIARFFVPFLGGVLLDRSLSVPATFMRRLFRAFSRGDAALPARGMGALPEAIARPLPRSRISLGARVEALDEGRCMLASGETLHPSKVILATDADTAAALLPDLAGPNPPRTAGWQRTTSCYYATRGPLPAPLQRPYLALNGGDGVLHHLAPLSTVAPEYAPPGEHLIVASHDGAADPTLEPTLRSELTAWFPSVDWRLVAVRSIAQALPRMTREPTSSFLRPQPWLTVAGDHIGDRSIDGALASGRQAAESLLAP